jgi:hypothetical protein
MFAGMVVGLACAVAVFAASQQEPPFAVLIFGGALAGVGSGLLFPGEALLVTEGTVHFVFGAVSVTAAAELDGVPGEPLQPAADSPEWLKAAFVFGVVYAAAVWLML